MLRIPDRSLAAGALAVLHALQERVNAELDYPRKVKAAKKAWDTKNSTKVKADAFQTIRQTLAEMCIGAVRCGYCEDSLADEVEHIHPKSFFPELTFSWENYLFSCGPCNGPKGSRYGIMTEHTVSELHRSRNDAVIPPPLGLSALIDPRKEDPLDILSLDLGGTTPDGTEINGTFEFFPADSAETGAQARAEFTIDVLGLNREVMRVARENAFGGFRARLREYVSAKQDCVSDERLQELQNDLLSTPHLTVFAEMRRQKHFLPEVRALLEFAPEAEVWALIPSVGKWTSRRRLEPNKL